jgi:hypothetical protein
MEKRTSHGVTAQVSYTISKNLSDMTNADNAYNRQAERSYASFDVPQRLTVSAAWDLPFGRGRRWGTNISRPLDLIAGGWLLSTFDTFQGGFPLTFGLTRGAAGSGSGRPNAAGDPSAGVDGPIVNRLTHYFNTSAFAQPADFTFGNVSPNIGKVRSPGMNQTNLTLSKDFRIMERWKLQFRSSLYNVLNHPVFAGPNTSFGNASFGIIGAQANLNRQLEITAKLVW